MNTPEHHALQMIQDYARKWQAAEDVPDGVRFKMKDIADLCASGWRTRANPVEENTTWMGRLKRWFRNLTDTRRQAQINRLMVRAARRCTRDLKHAVGEIENPERARRYRTKVEMWIETFWDCSQYRDQLHQELDQLESERDKLKARAEIWCRQIVMMGDTPCDPTPDEEIPF